MVKEKVSNPYHKSVFGVGYFGIGKYNSKIHLKIYKTWASMLQRCYDLKYQEKYLTYIGCSVDEKWHNFQNFAEWIEENYETNLIKSWCLDKDILVKGNKIYSPKTCCFVPNEVNVLFCKANIIRGKYPIGVTKVGNKYRTIVHINGKQVHLGYFDTPEEAFLTYKIAKERQIKEVAEKYKEQITEPTYQVLINYQVEITD